MVFQRPEAGKRRVEEEADRASTGGYCGVTVNLNFASIFTRRVSSAVP